MMGRSTGMGPGLLVLLLLNIALFLLDHVAHIPCQWLYLQVTSVAQEAAQSTVIETTAAPRPYQGPRHTDKQCLHQCYHRQHQQQPTEILCMTSTSSPTSTASGM